MLEAQHDERCHGDPDEANDGTSDGPPPRLVACQPRETGSRRASPSAFCASKRRTKAARGSTIATSVWVPAGSTASSRELAEAPSAACRRVPWSGTMSVSRPPWKTKPAPLNSRRRASLQKRSRHSRRARRPMRRTATSWRLAKPDRIATPPGCISAAMTHAGPDPIDRPETITLASGHPHASRTCSTTMRAASRTLSSDGGIGRPSSGWKPGNTP
jgi:hypothetical protein